MTDQDAPNLRDEEDEKTKRQKEEVVKEARDQATFWSAFSDIIRILIK